MFALGRRRFVIIISLLSFIIRMTLATIRRHALNCGLLLIPTSVWNIALTGYLPPAFAPAEFWRDIPAKLALAENSLRLAVFALPFLMPLDLPHPAALLHCWSSLLAL